MIGGIPQGITQYLKKNMKYYTQNLDIYQNSCSDKLSAFKVIFIHISFRWYNVYFRNVHLPSLFFLNNANLEK